jgi:excisionase family DNA binding protein
MDSTPKTQHGGPEASDFDHLPTVLTTREAANAVRIGVKELRKLVDTGHIPAARFGPRRLIRISRSALLATLNARSG